jgi:hypothetical protein
MMINPEAEHCLWAYYANKRISGTFRPANEHPIQPMKFEVSNDMNKAQEDFNEIHNVSSGFLMKITYESRK